MTALGALVDIVGPRPGVLYGRFEGEAPSTLDLLANDVGRLQVPVVDGWFRVALPPGEYLLDNAAIHEDRSVTVASSEELGMEVTFTKERVILYDET